MAADVAVAILDEIGSRPRSDRQTVRDRLDECVETYRRYLHLPDPGGLLMTVAAVAANRADSDPVWLILVGPPGGGKTEVIGGLSGLPDVYPAATLTEASLLSGTPRKEQADDARGGLLRTIGDFGIIVCKDFTSVLSMNRDARGALLAALREVYDGSWTRHVGTEGGRTLHWQGKIGLVAGCTPAIDSHHAVMGSMGERFVLFRLPPTDGDAQASRALAHIGSERTMRAEMAAAVRAVLEAVSPEDLTRTPDDDETAWLVSTSNLAVRCRSSVERDSYSREIELIPEAEAPARLALVLLRLYNGLRAIGTDEKTARALIDKAALDSMPAIRRAVLDATTAVSVPLPTTTIGDRIGYPTTTTRRACEDLAAHEVLRRIRGKSDAWEVTSWTRERWGIESFPEKSEESFTQQQRSDDDKTGKLTSFAGSPADWSDFDVDSDDAPLLTDDDAPPEDEVGSW